jgi:hypothetical protein
MPKLIAEGIAPDKFAEMTSTSGDVDLEGNTMTQTARANNAVTVQFSSINYSIKVGKGDSAKTKMILNNLSGKLLPGTMTAIMG